MEHSSLQSFFLWPATPLRRREFPGVLLGVAPPILLIFPTTGRTGGPLVNSFYPMFQMFVPPHSQVGDSDSKSILGIARRPYCLLFIRIPQSLECNQCDNCGCGTLSVINSRCGFELATAPAFRGLRENSI
jgi:hypothetical protein